MSARRFTIGLVARRLGFTLLEVIIAIGILVIGLLVLVDSQASSVFMVTEANNITNATMLADEKMTETLLVLEQEGLRKYY